MVKRILPRINFKSYRQPRYLLAVYAVFAPETIVYAGRYRRGACPICGPSKRPSRCFSWSFEKCSFYCLACGEKGDALELVRLLMKCSVMEAAKWLEERGGPSSSGLVLSGGEKVATRGS